MISPQLLQQRLRTAQEHGAARLELVAQLGEEDALLVTAQREERHRGAREARVVNTGSKTWTFN
eukprot:scaffold97287_cov48-Phaeocystis_antarctica.AAC.3